MPAVECDGFVAWLFHGAFVNDRSRYETQVRGFPHPSGFIRWQENSLILIKSPLELFEGQPVGRVTVGQPGTDGLLVSKVCGMAECEEENHHVALFVRGEKRCRA